MSQTEQPQLQTARLIIVDQDRNLEQVKVDNLETEFIAQGKSGKPVNFIGVNESLQSLKQAGYIFVKSDLPDDEVFHEVDIPKPRIYHLVVRHSWRSIDVENPAPEYGFSTKELTRDVTRTVTYLADNGVELAPIIQHAYFDGSGYIDEVTHKLVNIRDDGSVDLNNKAHLEWGSPQILPSISGLAGYEVVQCSALNESRDDVDRDGNIKEITVNADSAAIKLVITLNAVEKETKGRQGDIIVDKSIFENEKADLNNKNAFKEKQDDDSKLHKNNDIALRLVGLSGIKKQNKG